MTFKNQIEMFNWIWETRPHISEISGKPLLNKISNRWHWQFAHILPKGSYPSFKLNPDNIMLMLPEEHEMQEKFKKFTKKKDKLRQQYYEKIYNKKL